MQATLTHRPDLTSLPHNPSSSHPTCSTFDISLMPNVIIHRRMLHSYSVHYSLPKSQYVATISRYCEPTHDGKKTRIAQFNFATEREAHKFAKAYSPPKIMDPTPQCNICNMNFNSNGLNSCYCRNCGVCICEDCSVRWGRRMVPKTYVHFTYQPTTVRVCKSCNWLSNAFCMSLLEGRHNDALKIFETGNVNLRTCFADIRKEAMFPIHCAVMGGSIDLVKWLVDSQCCPVSSKRDHKTGKLVAVKTSADRTVIDLAMTGKPKAEILMFLIRKGLSIMDCKDITLAPKTLETLLRVGFIPTDIASPSPDVNIVPSIEDESLTTIEDACNLCFERTMDCVLVPCGHQVCCTICASQISVCPVCKVNCSTLRIFRP